MEDHKNQVFWWLTCQDMTSANQIPIENPGFYQNVDNKLRFSAPKPSFLENPDSVIFWRNNPGYSA